MSERNKMIVSGIIVSIIIGGIIITPHIIALAIAWWLVSLILDELFD